MSTIAGSDPYPFTTSIRHDEEHGYHVVLPDWSGPGVDELIVMQVTGEKLSIWRKDDPDAPPLDD